SFLLYSPVPPRHLHSFPTRRSSDLFDFDLTDSATQVATQTAGSAISGGVHQIDLSGVVANARSASAAAAALAPTQTFSTLSEGQDRKSTRLNSSHVSISYAVFCLKK